MPRRLGPDERVVLDLRPHRRRLVRPAVTLVVLAGAGSYAAAIVPGGAFQSGVRLAVAVAAVGLAVALVVRPWLRWRGSRLLVTDRRLLMRSGLLRRRGRDLPLGRVADVSFEQGPLERIFGSGTLVVEAGGEGEAVRMADVPSVRRVQEVLLELLPDARRW